MSHESIDREKEVELFKQFVKPDSRFRLLCLDASPHPNAIIRLNGKSDSDLMRMMGTSYLITKVFRDIIEKEYPQALCASIDVRCERRLTVPDYLTEIYNQLGKPACSHYAEARQIWMPHSGAKATGKNILALFSGVNVTAQSSSDAQSVYEKDRSITEALAQDLRKLDNQRIFLLFDSIHLAHPYIKWWIANTFLGCLSPIPSHLRVVIANYSLPAYHMCDRYTNNYKVEWVDKIDQYKAYCHDTRNPLSEEQVRTVMDISCYRPGQFAYFVSLAYM